MPRTVIKATEVARNLSDILNRVRYRGMSFDIQRGKEIIARITPAIPESPIDASQLIEAIASLPKLSEHELQQFEKDLKKLRKTVLEPKNQWD